MAGLEILEEACAGLRYTKRAMFGGHGLFAPNGGMFAAIVDDDRVALKLPDEAHAAFEAEGGRPWVYDGRMAMRAWFVIPDALYDATERLAAWTRRAHAAAKPSKAKAARDAKKAPAKKAAAKKPAAKKDARKASGRRPKGR